MNKTKHHKHKDENRYSEISKIFIDVDNARIVEFHGVMSGIYKSKQFIVEAAYNAFAGVTK